MNQIELDLKTVLDVLSDSEHEAWIHSQHCYLCDPRFKPRGPSERHHTGDGILKRRDVILSVPLHRGHHQLVTDEPYLERVLRLRKVAVWFLNLHLYEKFAGQYVVKSESVLSQADLDPGGSMAT